MCPCKCPVRIPRCGAVTVFKSKVGIVGNNMIGQTQALALLVRLPPQLRFRPQAHPHGQT